MSLFRHTLAEKSSFSRAVLVLGVGMLCLSAVVSLAQAQATPGQAPVDDKSLPVRKDGSIRPGVIASTGSYKGGAATDTVTSTPASGDAAAPVSASVKRIKRDECVVELVSSDQAASYSVNFVVEGINERGKKVLQKSFAATVGPKNKVTRNLSCREGLNLQVVLQSGKPLGAK